MVLPLCGSVWGQCCCLASGVLSRRKLSPGTHPVVRCFTFSRYATGALLAAAPVLEPRGSVSALSPKFIAGPLRGDS